ncbi:MAG: AAA family ATPase [Acidimicrobiales bacterium]
MPSGSLLIITGPPGAGKSTVAPLVAGRFDPAVHLESDWLWTTIVRGHIAPWLPEAHVQNGAVLGAAAAATRLALGGYTVVLNGIVGPWFLDVVTDEAIPAGVDVHYVVLRPSLETTLTRATTRLALVPGTAPLTDEGPIRLMWLRFQDLGWAEAHVIDTTDQDCEETVRLVAARFADGTDRLPPL